jgi:hypothetical protein
MDRPGRRRPGRGIPARTRTDGWCPGRDLLRDDRDLRRLRVRREPARRGGGRRRRRPHPHPRGRWCSGYRVATRTARSAAFDPDGWFTTGDVGGVHHEGGSTPGGGGEGGRRRSSAAGRTCRWRRSPPAARIPGRRRAVTGRPHDEWGSRWSRSSSRRADATTLADLRDHVARLPAGHLGAVSWLVTVDRLPAPRRDGQAGPTSPTSRPRSRVREPAGGGRPWPRPQSRRRSAGRRSRSSR